MKKLLNIPKNISSILEHIMALLVLVGIIIGMISLIFSLTEYWQDRYSSGSFLCYVDQIFNIVIGIEFFKVLWNPGKENLLEILMFVLARHMIINHNTSLENLLTVGAIGILFMTEKYLFDCHEDKEEL